MRQKIAQNLFLIFFSILITLIIVSAEFEVFEDSATTEAEDRAKALALSKTHFWKNLIENFNCENAKFNEPAEVGKKPLEELMKICFDWRKKAMAVNAYCKCIEKRMQGKGSTSKSSEKNIKESKCHFVKPCFLVEQGELQLCSAMEAIKAVYRDLFAWGQGEGLKIDITFENEAAFEYMTIENAQLPQIKKEERRNAEYINQLLSAVKLIKKNGKAKDTEILYLWHNAQELGLSWSSMCAAWIEFDTKTKIEKAPNLFSKIGPFSFIKQPLMNEKETKLKFEKELGVMFMAHKYSIYEPMRAKQSEDEELKQLQAKDPCEEAKLKVWDKKTVGMAEYGKYANYTDLANAGEMRNTFWLNMIAEWNCDRMLTNIKKSECEKWQNIAMQIDTYVQKFHLKFKEGSLEEFDKLEPPRLLIDQGELLMSSAMKVIKEVYREIYVLGQGNGLAIMQQVKTKNLHLDLPFAVNKTVAEIKANYTLRLLNLHEIISTAIKNYKKELELIKITNAKKQKQMRMESYQNEIHYSIAALWKAAEQVGAIGWSSLCAALLDLKTYNEKYSKNHKWSMKYLIEKFIEMFEWQSSNRQNFEIGRALSVLFVVYNQEHPKALDFGDPCEKAKLYVWEKVKGQKK